MDEDLQTTMKKVFNMFDPEKTGFVETSAFNGILKQLGANVTKDEVKAKCEEMDPNKTGQVDFDSFMKIVMPLMEEEDYEAMRVELKHAFRMYDGGEGFITPKVLKEILLELDSKLTSEELDCIIEEVDSDGSGSIDFDEFMEMMTG